jgi:hypothetical protein
MRKGELVRFVAVAALSLGIARASGAQVISDDEGAYRALQGTPLGALPPLMTSTILGRLQRYTQFSLRYGYLSGFAVPGTGQTDKNGSNNVAASVVIPMSLGSTVTGTAGIWYPSKADVNGNRHASVLLGLGGDYRIGSAALTDAAEAPIFTFGLDGELGFGKPRSATLWSAGVGVPLALVTRGQGMQIGTFVVPMIGFGNFDASNQLGGATFSGMRYSLGGGVGFYNQASTVSVNLGFQHVYISGAATLVGIAVSIGRS